MSLFSWLNDFFSPPSAPRRNAPTPPADDLSDNVRWLWNHVNERAVAHHDVRAAGWQIPLTVLLNGAGHLHRERTTMLFGLILSPPDQQEVQRTLGSHLAKTLAEWEDALEEAHGETGLTDFADLAVQNGYPMHRGTPTQHRAYSGAPRAPRKHPPPETPEEIEDAIVAWIAEGVICEEEYDLHHAWYVRPREGIERIEPTGDELLNALLSSSRRDEIESLTLGPWWSETGDVTYDYQPAITAIVEAALPNLEVLHIGDYTGEDSELSWTAECDVQPLLDAYPELVGLRIRASDVRFERLHGNALLAFEMESLELDAERFLSRLESSDAKQLKRLSFYAGVGGFSPSSLAPLFRVFPDLTNLGVENCDVSDQVATALVAIQEAGRLTALSFALGTLTDAGASALVEHADALPNLKHLDLTSCFLTPAMCEKLAAAFPHAEIRDARQRDEGQWGGLFISVEE